MQNISATKQNISARKVFVGLSGGVDSAVAAALLKKEGYDVMGAFIRIVVSGYPCTAWQDKIDAMRAAAHLRIPFLEVDLSSEYHKKIFEASVNEFKKGRTPNPDVLCNREIKFGLFYDWARERGAEYVATGHYARLQGDTLDQSSLRCRLCMSADKDKDQTYFLSLVPETTLRHTLFPVGNLTKKKVRALAKKLGLPNAERPDSQGLCFLGPVSMEDVLSRELRPVPGEVLDERGEAIGRHKGAALYTLGQRHGFETSSRERLYIITKDAGRNTITVSPDQLPHEARRTEISLIDANWIGSVQDGACTARYRYRQELIPAMLAQGKVTLREPHYVPVGQTLALYRGERCLGGGVIDDVKII